MQFLYNITISFFLSYFPNLVLSLCCLLNRVENKAMHFCFSILEFLVKVKKLCFFFSVFFDFLSYNTTMSREQKPLLAKEPSFEHHRLNFIDLLIVFFFFFISKTNNPSKNVVVLQLWKRETKALFLLYRRKKHNTDEQR